MDAGDNNRVSLDEVDLDFDENVDERVPVDLDDKLRFVDAPESDTGLTAPDYPKIVDMGAYENQGCTTDPDCDDDDPCNGVESCANGLCVVDFQNCNHNGIDDRCELAVIVDWKSIVTHGASNTIGLVIPSDNTFSESRNGGVTKLRLSFSSPIDADSVSPSNVTICGNDVNDQSVNLSGITVTTSVLSGNAAVDISFSPKLPNYARYRVRLNGVEDLACNTITTNNERVFTSLFGDITGDRRVNATDVGGVRSLVPKYTIDPNITPEVRSDVDNDNDIDDNDHTPPDSDVGLVRAEIPKDARYIADPTCP